MIERADSVVWTHPNQIPQSVTWVDVFTERHLLNDRQFFARIPYIADYTRNFTQDDCANDPRKCFSESFYSVLKSSLWKVQPEIMMKNEEFEMNRREFRPEFEKLLFLIIIF